MIEYILAAIVLAVVILLVFSSGSSRNRGSRISKDHSSNYHGVYSHDSKSPDSDVYFPVLKDFSSIMPMNKREERKKTETHQPRH
jgi:hypothetical protein